MSAHDELVAAAADDACARRARYHTPENGFTFRWPAVPAHQFLAERDRAFRSDTPSGLIALDLSAVLATPYPATTPVLLTGYLKLRAGDTLRTAFAGSGEAYYVMAGAGESRNGGAAIAWEEGDVFCFPGGMESRHRAGAEDCLLFCVTDDPLVRYARLRPPAPGEAAVAPVHWPAAETERRFEAVYRRPITSETTGHSVQFGSAALSPSPNTLPFVNMAINTLAAGCDQRPHRHNGVAVTLALQADGIHSVIDGQRVDWSAGAAQITPASALHSHHNRGSRRMRSLVIQDEGLHYYTRTPGFSFD